jgi:glycoprotein 2-beta-D-xylosyltransferase
MMAGRAHGHRNRLRRLIPRLLLLLVAVYAASFAIYLLLQSHSHHQSPPDPTPRTEARDGVLAPSSSQKPWPRLPSFLPWVSSAVPPPPLHTCEAYFGNGFSRRVDVLPAGRGSGGGGWFRCHHSETLGSSICEGARVRLDPALIAMSRGGEPLEQVMGRAEEEELPKYEPGALQVEGPAAGMPVPLVDAGFLNDYVPTGGIGMHTMRALLESTRVVPPGELHCSQVLFALLSTSRGAVDLLIDDKWFVN